jgi:transposase
MPPEGIDSLDAKCLKGLVLSLLAKIDELFEQNKKLLEQNSALLERIAELEGRAGKPPKNPTNSSLPPSSGQKANVADKSGRKKKCRKGRPGVARELCPNPDVTRDFFAERCDCGGKVPLKGQVLAHAYDHIEIPPIRPWTTRNNLYKGDCSCCGKTVTAKPPVEMPPGSPFGPGIVALVTYLHGCQMVSYARLAEMLEGLFGLKISEGAIANMLARAAEPFAECAQTIHETVRNSPVIASDETSARVKGKTHWQWTFVAATAVAHLIAPTRGKIVPTQFLNGLRPKVWLSDRLAAQCKHGETHQFCLAHLIRDALVTPSMPGIPCSPRHSKSSYSEPAISAAAGPISPMPPSRRTRANLSASSIACSSSSRSTPMAATCETPSSSTPATSCSSFSPAATSSRPITHPSGPSGPA